MYEYDVSLSLSLYVCVEYRTHNETNIYIYICMYVCLYVCMYVCLYVCMYVGMYVRVYVYVRTYIYIYVCICIHVSTLCTAKPWPFGLSCIGKSANSGGACPCSQSRARTWTCHPLAGPGVRGCGRPSSEHGGSSSFRLTADPFFKGSQLQVPGS